MFAARRWGHVAVTALGVWGADSDPKWKGRVIEPPGSPRPGTDDGSRMAYLAQWWRTTAVPVGSAADERRPLSAVTLVARLQVLFSTCPRSIGDGASSARDFILPAMM